ncbi:hypothetical protein CROQUDRAFT_667535 [Cronartium quercuum f. sp. fusiforme G11]|uniref:GAF domain-containing protein n=1 Tax=Cronartium quercuum f. sp. fusiforme G11 TaxID=708437 RepID=A0A9P6NU13_9BASI|nr:hypothetical protein CROQUDRAFT_667535 [Cronartium quercuum f. sp. fusiforme G11]
MVHAEASSIPAHLALNCAASRKTEFYAHVAGNLKALLDGEKNWVVNLSNAASVLFHAYSETNEGRGRGVNWTGFYLLPHLFPQPTSKKSVPQSPPIEPFLPRKLLLGPFQGKPACQFITLPLVTSLDPQTLKVAICSPASVCATAFVNRSSQLVTDVEQFPGHIACDPETKSELVVPILIKREGVTCCVGVLDLDCTFLNGFDEADVVGVESVLSVVIGSSEWW